MEKLIEENLPTSHVYMDDATGDCYFFDGTKLVKFVEGNPIEIGDRPSDEEIEEEDRKREEQIKKDLEEYGDYDNDESDEEYDKRVKELRKILDDEQTLADIEAETSQVKYRKDKAKAASRKEIAKSAAARNTTPIEKFKLSLKKFISKSVVDKFSRERSYAEYNANYGNSKFIMPGYGQQELPKKIPLINVYLDQSSSWEQADLDIAFSALQVIREYEKKKQIRIKIYYFANHVSNVNDKDVIGRGTGAGKELIEHIQQTKPDNVIVMTDGDFDSWDEITHAPKITVKGAVWILFRREVSYRLLEHLKGRKLNEHYII